MGIEAPAHLDICPCPVPTQFTTPAQPQATYFCFGAIRPCFSETLSPQFLLQVLVMSRGKKLSSYHAQIVKAELATICVDFDTLHDEEQIGNYESSCLFLMFLC